MNVLILIDKPNWAYHSIAKALVKYNNDPDLHLEIIHVKKNASRIKKIYKKFDRILVMGWQNYQLVTFIPKNIVMVGLHSFHSWDDRKTTIEKDVKPPSRLLDDLSKFSKVNAVSLRLTNLFKKHGIDVTYTPNGVDTAIFKRISKPPVGKKLIVGYSGSKGHDWRKGVSKFIEPASKKSNVGIKIAMLSTGNHIKLEEMYKFYQGIDVYICASLSEGMSLSVLEAASCGRPVISTRVSGNVEFLKEGQTAFFVDRKVEEFVKAVNKFKDPNTLSRMSDNIEKDMRENWCWGKQAPAWIDYLSGERK